MRFGPINPLDLNRLTEILDSHKANYNVDVSSEALDAYAAHRLEHQPRSRAEVANVEIMEYIYLDVPDDKVPLIQKELERILQCGSRETRDMFEFVKEMKGPYTTPRTIASVESRSATPVSSSGFDPVAASTAASLNVCTWVEPSVPPTERPRNSRPGEPRERSGRS